MGPLLYVGLVEVSAWSGLGSLEVVNGFEIIFLILILDLSTITIGNQQLLLLVFLNTD